MNAGKAITDMTMDETIIAFSCFCVAFDGVSNKDLVARYQQESNREAQSRIFT